MHRKGAVRQKTANWRLSPAHGFLQLCGDGKGESGEFLFLFSRSRAEIFQKRRYGSFSCEDVILDLRKQGVVLGKKGKADVQRKAGLPIKISIR